MTWVFITLVILACAGLMAHLLKFRLALSYRSPAGFSVVGGISFLWLQWDFHLPDESGSKSGLTVRIPSSQSGFLAVPESWLNRFKAMQKRLRLAAIKFALDPKVWRLGLSYIVKTGKRTVQLLHPAIESIHVGMEDVLSLGRFAAIWSSLSALVPFFSCPITYAFNEKPSSSRLKLTAGFTGLQAFVYLWAIVFTIPWIPLSHRFHACWRNPRLNRWQRRLLLF